MSVKKHSQIYLLCLTSMGLFTSCEEVSTTTSVSESLVEKESTVATVRSPCSFTEGLNVLLPSDPTLNFLTVQAVQYTVSNSNCAGVGAGSYSDNTQIQRSANTLIFSGSTGSSRTFNISGTTITGPLAGGCLSGVTLKPTLLSSTVDKTLKKISLQIRWDLKPEACTQENAPVGGTVSSSS